MRFLLFVGASNTLATTEIKTQIPEAKEWFPNVFVFESDSNERAISLAAKLGSSIKLAIEVENVVPEAQSISDVITQKNFSISCLSETSHNDFNSANFNQEVKNAHGKGRFIIANDPFGLSPVILKKHKVDEFFVDLAKEELWKTVWVHDYEHWIAKDRHMPFANARAGILPPKIARSMANLVPLNPEGKLLVDPFCGSGRVLVEAAELGYKVAGTDIQETQCKETLTNLSSLGFNADISVLDATHLSDKFKNNVDAIVTEPFLGKPNLRPDQVKYVVPGLKKLYIGCLKNWLAALKSGGFVVMVFPSFFDGKTTYNTSDIIDERLEQGYNIVKRGILYSRPEADVKREIVILQKK